MIPFILAVVGGYLIEEADDGFIKGYFIINDDWKIRGV